LCHHHGRFLREDPLSFTAGDTNLYRYVHNRPNSYTDPSGKYLVVGFGEHMDWLNWLWGLGIHAVGWPIYEYGRPTLVYIYIPFAERERLREILNAEVAAGRLNREWAENLLRGLAGNVHVRGYGDLSISWANLDDDIILQILSANAQQMGVAFNANTAGGTFSYGMAGDLYLLVIHVTWSVEFNIAWSKRWGLTCGPSHSWGWGWGIGIGGGAGPQVTITNAGSVDQLDGWARHEGVFVSGGPWFGGYSGYEVDGTDYDGAQVSSPLGPSASFGIGYSRDWVWTWMWQWW
jgi:hypothetical protein